VIARAARNVHCINFARCELVFAKCLDLRSGCCSR
jgi:hypothetical protein